MRFKILVILLFCSVYLFSQPPESYKFFYHNLPSSTDFYFDYLGFFKNNEYFGITAKGYTLIGERVNFGILMKLKDSFFVDFNFLVLQLFGDKSIVVNPKLTFFMKENNWFVCFGDLYGYSHNRLLSQIVNSEFYYLSGYRRGAEIKFETKNWMLDSWVNWRQFIHFGAKYPEIFNLGFNLERRYFIDRQKVVFNLQLFATHRGGQIDLTSEPAVSVINLAFGGYSLFTVEKWKVRMLSYFLAYRGINVDFFDYPFDFGLANYSAVECSNNSLIVKAGIWVSNTYLSTLGDAYFMNYSLFDGSFEYVKVVFSGAIDWTKSFSDNLKLKMGVFLLADYNFRFDYGYYLFLRYRFKAKQTEEWMW